MGEAPPGADEILAKIEAAGESGPRPDQAGAARVLASATLDLAENLVSQDDVIDRLNREVFNAAVEIGGDDRRARMGART